MCSATFGCEDVLPLQCSWIIPVTRRHRVPSMPLLNKRCVRAHEQQWPPTKLARELPQRAAVGSCSVSSTRKGVEEGSGQQHSCRNGPGHSGKVCSLQWDMAWGNRLSSNPEDLPFCGTPFWPQDFFCLSERW